MKNITLAMGTVLALVAMLSAVLAVPMQQAIAEDRDGKDGKYSRDGDENSIDSVIKQELSCDDNENTGLITCTNTATVSNLPVITLPDMLP